MEQASAPVVEQPAVPVAEQPTTPVAEQPTTEVQLGDIQQPTQTNSQI